MDPGTTPELLLERYRVEGILGEGGLGTVYKARDTRLPRHVAIKTIKRSLVSDPDVFRALDDRFSREADASTRTGSHPNLVTVYDLVTSATADRTRYLIQEFVPGGTLEDRIKAGPLPLAECLRLTTDAARGLGAAHEMGIVHRDIKPANIFIAADGRAQVGDFGIAQIDSLSGRTSATTGHPGTPLYMSPEQAQTTGYVRPSSDQYSLGLVLFEMLTGTAYKRLEQHEADALLAQQPAGVVALVRRMLSIEPGDRYPGMAGVLAAIRDVEASSIGEPAIGRRPQRGSPALDDVTRRETPRVNLAPAPPVAERRPAPAHPAQPSQRVLSRRSVLAGIGGAALAGGAAGGVYLSRHSGGADGSIATATTGAIAPVPPSASRSISPVSATATNPPLPVAASSTQANPTVVASAVAGPTAISSLLAYLDGRAAIPGETQDLQKNVILGDPVQVIGVDFSRTEPSKLSAVSAPGGSRVVRTLWAPKGTLLATLVRQPVAGGFSTALDLAIIDIATGQMTTAAKGINSLPAWAPDSATLVYATIAGKKPAAQPGSQYTDLVDSYDIHLVQYDGRNDSVIANVAPPNVGFGGGNIPDPIEALMRADQFFYARSRTVWAADNSRIGITVGFRIFTMRPDGSDIRLIDATGTGVEDAVGPTTDDPYVPTNGLQIRLADEDDALHWRYERGSEPVAILDGCAPPDDRNKACDNTRKGTANAGYRNQIIARLADGTERKLTNSPTFKYHVLSSPDGTAIAYTGVSVTNYNAAKVAIEKNADQGGSYTGYSTDIYLVRLTGGNEQKVSTTGTAHHPSWQRDIAVRVAPRATVAAQPTAAAVATQIPASPSVSPGTIASQTTWSDPETRITLTYPAQRWHQITEGTDQFTILGLQNASAVYFYVSKYVRGSANAVSSAFEGLQGYKDRQTKISDRTYSQGPIQQLRIDGAPAASMDFQWTKKSDPSVGRVGTTWYIDGFDLQFVLETYVDGKTFGSRDDMTAIINSVRIAK